VKGNLHTTGVPKFLIKGNQNGEDLGEVCFGHNLTMAKLGNAPKECLLDDSSHQGG
jgi:hypothetical protein